MASTGVAIIVEGYTDVIVLHGAGVENAVATLGTALTVQHIRTISRHAKHRIVYLFDGDEAGQRAADRAARFVDESMLPEAGRSRIDLCAVTLPDNLDPADFVQRNTGRRWRSFSDRRCAYALRHRPKVSALQSGRFRPEKPRAIRRLGTPGAYQTLGFGARIRGLYCGPFAFRAFHGGRKVGGCSRAAGLRIIHRAARQLRKSRYRASPGDARPSTARTGAASDREGVFGAVRPKHRGGLGLCGDTRANRLAPGVLRSHLRRRCLRFTPNIRNARMRARSCAGWNRYSQGLLPF